MQKYIVDIDGTLCTIADDYANAVPFADRIKKINELYDADNIIIIFTGRHWNRLSLTIEQLIEWGVKYHSLSMSKPVGMIIDDMSMRPEEFFKAP